MTKTPVTKTRFIELLNDELKRHPDYLPTMGGFTVHNAGEGYIWPQAHKTYGLYVDVAREVHARYYMED